MSVAPAEVEWEEAGLDAVPDTPWVTIVWNDPINLMSYVTYVFQKVFGYAKPKAEKLMLDVHHKGKAVVSNGTREAMERDAEVLHGYGLWATVSHDRWAVGPDGGSPGGPSLRAAPRMRRRPRELSGGRGAGHPRASAPPRR